MNGAIFGVYNLGGGIFHRRLRRETAVPLMILIVEDNPNARQLFARILASVGYKTLECEDGGEALRLLDSHCFDLVLTDLALPNTTGFGVIAHIRKTSPRLPIILVTGYLAPSAAKAVLDEFIEFIPKPVNRDHLIAAVNRLIPAAPERAS